MNMDVFEQWESEIRGYCRANPTVFASASGAHMVAEDGKRYIDFFSGAGVLNFGHNNPHMKKAMIEFLENDGMAHSLDLFTTTKREFIQSFAETILKPRNMHYKMQFMGPTGTNAVDLDACRERGVPVCNIPAYSTDSVAEHVFALILAAARRVEAHAEAVRKGEWSRSRDFCFTLYPQTELAGKTLGLIGFGDIAQSVARIAAAFRSSRFDSRSKPWGSRTCPRIRSDSG